MTNLCLRARVASILIAITWSACSTTSHWSSRVRHAPGRLYYFLANVLRAAKNPHLFGLKKRPRPLIVNWYVRIVRSPC